MRSIIVRGKNKTTNDWVFGDLFQHGEQRFIMADNRNTEVIPETVGQFTGLSDHNGTNIFEGDICHFYGGEYYLGIWEVNAVTAITNMTNLDLLCYLHNAENVEVIGNIYDNPELLEEV